jgi:short subunit dehydrogenase-like uncharacterized protein
MKSQWMIYGANGYSAQLAIEKAVEQGKIPILAGRNQAEIEALGKKFDLPVRVFDLSNIDKVAEQLADVIVVSHCAGPFSATAEPMMKACIKAGTHYTDITGEGPVFRITQSFHEQAKKAGVVLMSGAGFDVIPTDCLANFLHQQLPDATDLVLGFDGNMAFCPGTSKTMMENLYKGMAVRRKGKIKFVGRGFEMRTIDFGRDPKLSSVIPWGDLETAHWQSNIPNISVYLPFTGSKLEIMLFPLLKLVLSIPFVRKRAIDIAGRTRGPSAEKRGNNCIHVWGEIKNSSGKVVTTGIEVQDGYTVTMDGIIMSADYLRNYQGEGGCYTPSQLMGNTLAEPLPGAGSFSPSVTHRS